MARATWSTQWPVPLTCQGQAGWSVSRGKDVYSQDILRALPPGVVGGSEVFRRFLIVGLHPGVAGFHTPGVAGFHTPGVVGRTSVKTGRLGRLGRCLLRISTRVACTSAIRAGVTFRQSFVGAIQTWTVEGACFSRVA